MLLYPYILTASFTYTLRENIQILAQSLNFRAKKQNHFSFLFEHKLIFAAVCCMQTTY